MLWAALEIQQGNGKSTSVHAEGFLKREQSSPQVFCYKLDNLHSQCFRSIKAWPDLPATEEMRILTPFCGPLAVDSSECQLAVDSSVSSRLLWMPVFVFFAFLENFLNFELLWSTSSNPCGLLSRDFISLTANSPPWVIYLMKLIFSHYRLPWCYLM